MNLSARLQNEHSKELTLEITAWIGTDATRFASFMEVFLTEETRIVQRAAWVLGYVGEAHPQLLFPYLAQFLVLLRKEEIHDAVKRNILRVLQTIEIPEQYQGEMVELCFEILHSQEAIAIKAFAMKVLYNICLAQPELMPELKQVIEERLPFESKGFQNRGRKILRGEKI